MTTFSILTLGCKVNQYESQQIRELLEQFGLRRAGPDEKSDLVVVNTCCVTRTASAKSRQYIHRAQGLNPDAVIVVCGCLPTVQIGELTGLTEKVHLAGKSGNRRTCPNSTIKAETGHKIKPKNQVTHLSSQQLTAPTATTPEQKGNLPELTSAGHSSDPTGPPVCSQANEVGPRPADSRDPMTAAHSGSPGGGPQMLPMISSFEGHARAFLKVQDGCDGHCSYCIVPKTRPFVHSKPVEDVLSEARALVGAGHKEIVVTGIFLGAYGEDSVRRRNWAGGRNDRLAEMLDMLAEVEGLGRIRLSSLEPGDVTERLLDTLCGHRNIMPHLHLALQSGSDAVLKRMCRQYDSGQFREVVGAVKGRMDRPAITTDIIVGFPGETEDDFEQTVKLAREAGFAKMHIFPYSARKGTAATKMQGAVDNRVIKERARILRDLNDQSGREFRGQFVGESAEILIENVSDGRAGGRSERYFMVNIGNIGKSVKRSDLVAVRLIENSEDGMIGE